MHELHIILFFYKTISLRILRKNMKPKKYKVKNIQANEVQKYISTLNAGYSFNVFCHS